jgi:glycyl-tRNA synthetase
MSDKSNKVNLEQLASLCKRRGFIFQSSELYGGINGFWDYGPLGVELKRNIKDAWWRDVVQRRDDVVGLDSSIIMHPRIWEASGHLEGFSDPMIDCKTCQGRFRADQMDTSYCPKKPSKKVGECGGELTEPRQFNLMFKTFVGPVQDDSSVAYLRPETAQGIFAQFDNVLSVSRQKVPFGIAQIGKAFRNEINPRNYTFRSREFEQMELEFFIKPGTDQEWHDYWVKARLDWYSRIGIAAAHLDKYVYDPKELAHYASACVDIMYQFPFGLQELEGIAARGNYDLSRHSEFSGKKLEYFDQETNERFIPHVVEPSAGVDRIALAVLCEAYQVEWIPKEGNGDGIIEAVPGEKMPAGYEERTVLRFAPCVAPVKAAIFPLLKNKPELVDMARKLYDDLKLRWPVFYDQAGAIGRRYRRQDEVGTPFGITVDFESLEQGTVTWRERDSMAQERIPLAEVAVRLDAALA